MTKKRNRLPCTRNNRWFDRYENGFFCLPRDLMGSLAGKIDNAALYVYVMLASCHFENNTCYAGSAHLARLTGKDERAVRRYMNELVGLGLIEREPLGKGYKIIFLCPTMAEIKEGAERVAEQTGKSIKTGRSAIKTKARPVPMPPQPSSSKRLGRDHPDDFPVDVDEYGNVTFLYAEGRM